MIGAPNRRQFLQTAAGAALAARGVRGANDRLNLAFIGMGRMGSANLRFGGTTPGVEVAAVCDVYQPALERAQAQARKLGFGGCKAIQDFREILADRSIDAVSIATPDHWHAYMTVEACKAGKDVWVEKPACVYVEEGVRMVEAARKYQRVVQAGTMQRSGGFFQKAREIVKRGDLGEISFCRTFQAETSTAGVDGLDMVQFAFNEAMPLSVAAQGGRFYADDETDTPATMLVTYRYPGFVASYENRRASCGTSFHGTDATLVVNRDGYQIFPAGTGGESVEEKSRELAAMHEPHWRNFVECVRTRQKPTSDIETCVRTTTTCLLANLAYRHGVALDWDERAFTVKQDEIKQYLRAEYRSPWKLEV